jgi:hypothetical protein
MKKLVIFGIVAVVLVACIAWAAIDYQCMSDCIARYSWDYCQRVCSY